MINSRIFLINRKGNSLIIKPIFGIFLVIFVFLVFFVVGQNRTQSLKTKYHFSYYDRVNSFLLTLLSNPNCLSVGKQELNQSEELLQGVLDIDKLNKNHNKNKDLWCVENFKFMYSLDVTDIDDNRSWIIGINISNLTWIERKLTITLPNVIRYNGTKIDSAKVSINAFIGDIPKLYGLIKRTCISQKDSRYMLNSEYSISYDSNTNILNIGRDYFYPYFSCKVNDFQIFKGKNVIYLNYQNNTVNLIQ